MVLPSRAGAYEQNSPGSGNSCRLFWDCDWLASRGRERWWARRQFISYRHRPAAKNCPRSDRWYVLL